MNYMITKEMCQHTIDSRFPIVCRGCGGKLTPIETVDNADNPTFWIGCLNCMCFDSGTTPKTFIISERMFTNRRFRAYNNDEPNEVVNPVGYKDWKNSQIRGIVSIVEDVLHLNNIV